MPNWKKVIVSGSNAVLNNITSSGNISASGDIITDVLKIGGPAATDVALYRAASDNALSIGFPTLDIDIYGTAVNIDSNVILPSPHTLDIGSHITASGNISSSGTITAAAAVLTTADINGGTIDGITSLTAGGNLDIGSHTFRAQKIHGDGHITVGDGGSDSISLINSTQQTLAFTVGDDTSDEYALMGSGGFELQVGSLSIPSDLKHLGDTNTKLSFTTDKITLTAGGVDFITMTEATSDTLVFGDVQTTFSGNITASGDISSSGTIIANKLEAASVSDTLAAAIVAEIDNDEIPIAKLAEDAVTVTSGTNLSGGGTITLGGSITLNVDDAFLKNDADDTTTGTITSAGLIATKATDGGNTTIQIINSDTDSGLDKGAGIEFKHGSAAGLLSGNQKAGKILATKASAYQGTTSLIDSNLEFYTANNDTDTLQLKIDNTGLAEFTGNISSSAASTGSFGRVEADSFSKQICVTNHGFALDSNTSAPNYFPLNNLNETRAGDTAQYYARMIAPYDGRVVKVMVRADADIGNSCSVVLTKLSTSGQSPDGLRDEGTDVETVSGVDCSTLNTTHTFAFTNGAFSSGDVVNVGLQKNSSNTANVTAVVVWEYTL